MFAQLRTLALGLSIGCGSGAGTSEPPARSEPLSNRTPNDGSASTNASGNDEAARGGSGDAGGLRVTGVEPEVGDELGGTFLVIKGEGFMKHGPRNVKVYFGPRQGTVIRFQSDRELIVQAPGGKANEIVDVMAVFDPGGTLTLSKAFKFVAAPTPAP